MYIRGKEGEKEVYYHPLHSKVSDFTEEHFNSGAYREISKRGWVGGGDGMEDQKRRKRQTFNCVISRF